MATDFNEADIREFLELIGHEHETELRAIIPKKENKNFHFSSKEDIIKKCKELNGKYNLYIGINERKIGGTAKADIVSVGLFQIDIDSVKKPATTEDLKEVEKAVSSISNDYIKLSCQKPSIVCSGNGYQLYFKIPKIEINDSNRKEVEDKIKSFGKELIKKYSNEKVRLDDVYDLPRIMRIPGTINLKSETLSKIVSINKNEDNVFKDLLFSSRTFEVKAVATREQIEAVKSYLKIEYIIDISKYKKLSNRAGEYQGEHPFHASDTGTNFDFNLVQQVWKCWHDNCGGDPLLLYAMKKGFIQCGEKLEGDTFHKTVLSAIEEYNINVKPKSVSKSDYQQYEITDEMVDAADISDIEIVRAEDVANYPIKPAEPIVEGGILYKNQVTLMGGRSGAYKSLTALEIAHKIVLGEPVFNRYKTEPMPVLYLNEENTWSVFKAHVTNIQNALDFSKKKCLANLHFCTYQNLSLDVGNVGKRTKLEKMIKTLGIKVLFIDVLKRTVNFDENDANRVNEWYNVVIKPLVAKYKLTPVLIMHTKKENVNPNIRTDKKDLIRGSSDFINIADNILYFEKGVKAGLFNLYQLKNRVDEEFATKTIKIVFDKKAGFGFEELTTENKDDNELRSEICAKDILRIIYEKQLRQLETGKNSDMFKKVVASQENHFNGHSSSAFNEAIQKLVTDHILVKEKKGVYKINQQHFIWDDFRDEADKIFNAPFVEPEEDEVERRIRETREANNGR